MSVKVTGLERTIAMLEAVPSRIDDGAEEALEEIAGHIENTAKSIVPVLEGKLRDSIESVVEDGEAYIFTDSPYAEKISKTHPTGYRFMERAVSQNAYRIQETIAKKIEDNLR